MITLRRTIAWIIAISIFILQPLDLAAQDCSTCDTNSPDFNLIFVPQITSTNMGGGVVAAEFLVFFQNNTTSDINISTIAIDIGVNTLNASSLVNITGDAEVFPNLEFFNMPIGSFVFIFDDFPAGISNMINTINYNNSYDYDHIVAGPAYPPQVVQSGIIAQVATLTLSFTGMQVFTDSDPTFPLFLGNRSFFHLYSGQCVDPQNNVNNTFGFTLANGSLDVNACYNAYFDAMPVFLSAELSNFEGIVQESSNQLEWTTLTENNTLWHIIESSVDPLHHPFQEIGKVNAAGESQSRQDYSFIDNNPYPITYYRLKTVDHDGMEQFSKIIRLERRTNLSDFVLFPNPASGQIEVQFAASGEEDAEFSIFGALGKEYIRGQIPANEQSFSRIVDIDALVPGIYTLKVQAGDSFGAKSFIVH